MLHSGACHHWRAISCARERHSELEQGFEPLTPDPVQNEQPENGRYGCAEDEPSYALPHREDPAGIEFRSRIDLAGSAGRTYHPLTHFGNGVVLRQWDRRRLQIALPPTGRAVRPEQLALRDQIPETDGPV